MASAFPEGQPVTARQPDHTDPAFRPKRPPLSARWREYGALVRPTPAIEDPPVVHDSNAAASAGPVLVIPGLARGDGQTRSLRAFLDRHGYLSFGWELGVDVGPTRRLMEGIASRLTELHSLHGPVNLVGLSMGGLFCRWLALQSPDLVRQVVTVCTPFRCALDSFFLPLRPMLPLWPGPDLNALALDIERTLPVPSTLLYTRSDGTVAWESCYDPRQPDDCFEITGPHMTIAANPDVRAALLQRLPRTLG